MSNLNPAQFQEFEPRRTDKVDLDFTPYDFNDLSRDKIRTQARRSQRDWVHRQPYSDRARHMDDTSGFINPDADKQKYARDVVTKSIPFESHYIPKAN